MEEVESKMNEKPEEQRAALRKYLLGILDDKAEMRRIEEKILLDENFAEQLSIAEDELADDYLDGILTERECERFLHFFSRLARKQRKAAVHPEFAKICYDSRRRAAGSTNLFYKNRRLV